MTYKEHSTVKDRPFSFVLLSLAIIALIILAFYLKDNKTYLLVDGILLLFAIATLLVWLVKNKTRQLKVNSDNVLYEVGLFNKEVTEIKISSVRTVKINQSFINRIFSVGNIEVYTAGDSPEFVAKAMPNPHKFREVIQKIEKIKDQETIESQEEDSEKPERLEEE